MDGASEVRGFPVFFKVLRTEDSQAVTRDTSCTREAGISVSLSNDGDRFGPREKICPPKRRKETMIRTYRIYYLDTNNN